MEFLFLILGLAALIYGGDTLVKGAVSIALKAKISPLVVGMTVVSFGTSAPELLVSLKAALSGHPDVSIGAVVGSNISNLGLVLGITVLVFPIVVNRDSLKIDWPMMMFSSLLFFFFARDGEIVFSEGLVFVSILVLFTIWLVVRSRKKGVALAAEEEAEELGTEGSMIKDLGLVGLGMLGLYFGAEWLIDSVVSIAKSWGISEKLISVTVVAFGTSVPELVTSCVAAVKKETDISIGNLIGSNLFNLLAIIGITAIVHPIKVASSINQFDIYYMLGISLILFPFMLLGRKIGRIKGMLLLLAYLFYVYFSISVEF